MALNQEIVLKRNFEEFYNVEAIKHRDVYVSYNEFKKRE